MGTRSLQTSWVNDLIAWLQLLGDPFSGSAS